MSFPTTNAGPRLAFLMLLVLPAMIRTAAEDDKAKPPDFKKDPQRIHSTGDAPSSLTVHALGAGSSQA